MKKVRPEKKRRAFSDESGKKQHQDAPHVKARSFTDLFSFFRTKTTKKQTSTDLLTSLEETYAQPRLPPALPPKKNIYYVNKGFDSKEIDHIYEEIYLRGSMNVEPGLWIIIQPHTSPNREASREVNDTDLKEREVEDGSTETTTTVMTHKRNSSDLSFGSFHMGPPVELMSEVLTGEDWATFLEENLKFTFDPIQPDSDHYEVHMDLSEFTTEQETMPENEDEETSLLNTGPDVEHILQSVKIVHEKLESPQTVKESEPDPVLPPPLPFSSSCIGVHKFYRSSVFYKFPPAEPEETAQDKHKSSRLILEKFLTKLRKSSVDEALIKENEGQ